MKLCIAGKNNIAVDCLHYSLSFISKKDICVVLNKTDSLKNTWQKSLGFHAQLLGIKILELEDVQNIKEITFLSLEFDRIIKPEQFKTTKLYNIHFSFLPEYKGMYTSLLPILHGKSYSGVTLHLIDKGIDTGNIIDQVSFNIKNMNCNDLYFNYLKYGTMLVCSHVKELIHGIPNSGKQPVLNSSYYSKTSFDFSLKEINPKQTAHQIFLFTLALNFRVYQLPTFKGNKINKCKLTAIKSNLKPGTIIKQNSESIEIASIDYNVKLYIDYYDKLLDCCKNDDFLTARSIINYIVDLNDYDKNGWTPLIVACYNGSLKVTKLLLNAGANPNKTNLNGTTSLMYAKDTLIQHNKYELIKLLLNYKAESSKKDIWGKTIFDYTDDPKLIKLLTQ